LQLVPSVELLFADPIQIVDRNLRPGTGAGDVECQDVFGQGCLHLDPRALWRTCRYASEAGPSGPNGCNARARNAPHEAVWAKLNYNEINTPSRRFRSRDEHRNST